MKYRFIKSIALGSLLMLSCSRDPRPIADLILKNGDFYTVNRSRPRVQALAIRGNRIVAVGSNAEIMPYEGESTRIIDVHGRFGCPGFNDSHTVLLDLGLSTSPLDLTGIRSTRHLQSRVYQTQRRLPPNDWLIGRGWDQHLLPGGQWPTRQMLDRVVRDIPIFLIRKCGQAALVNTRALTIANIDAETPAPEGGEIVKGRGTGNPTGILKGEAMNLVVPYIPPASREKKLEALQSVLDTLRYFGITSIQTLIYPGDLDLLREVLESDRPTCRVSAWLPLDAGLEEAVRIERVLNDSFLRFAGMSLRLDGSLGASSARFRESYFQESENRGLLYRNEEDLRRMIVDAHRGGFRLNMQAVGSEANRIALDCIEIANRFVTEHPRRHRVACARVLYPEDVARFGALDLIAVMQPSALFAELDWVESVLGTGRSRFIHAYRSLKNHGAVLAFSSDWPVSSLNPMMGLYAAVTRQDTTGLPVEGFHPRERISMEEAIEAYTWGSASAEGTESEKGTLESGKLADIVILDGDPIVVSSGDVKNIRVVLTILDGQIVYSSSDLESPE